MNVESCERTLLNLVQNSCLCIFLPKVKVNSFHWEHKNIKYYELSKQVDFNKEIKNIWDPVIDSRINMPSLTPLPLAHRQGNTAHPFPWWPKDFLLNISGHLQALGMWSSPRSGGRKETFLPLG